MRLKFGTTIFDSLGTDSTVLGTAMSTLYLQLDPGSPTDEKPSNIIVSEDEDAVTLRFFLTYTAANIGTLKTNVDLIARALTDPPGTSVVLESVSGTTLREWLQSSQQYMAATGAVNIHYGSATTALFECVVSLSKTPFRGAGISSTPLALEGRAGPHTIDMSIPASGIREIRVSATFVPLGNGTSAQDNAIAWIAAVEARSASNLSWLPTADQAPIIDSGLTGQGDFDSKTLASVEAFVLLRVLPQDLIGLSATARVVDSRLALSARERGFRIGTVGDPGYDFLFTAEIDYRVQDNVTAAYPSSNTVQADFKVLFDAAIAKIRGGPASDPQTRKVDRVIDAGGGKVRYEATGSIAANAAEAKIASITETVRRSRPGNVNFVPDYKDREVIYVGPSGPSVIVHMLAVTQADGYATYSPPDYFQGSYFLEGDVEEEPQQPIVSAAPSDSMTVTGMTVLYPIVFTAIYRERRSGARTFANGRLG